VGVLISFEPCESLAFFFFRKLPNDGMDPWRLAGMLEESSEDAVALTAGAMDGWRFGV
jgi:hypothetical protein